MLLELFLALFKPPHSNSSIVPSARRFEGMALLVAPVLQYGPRFLTYGLLRSLSWQISKMIDVLKFFSPRSRLLKFRNFFVSCFVGRLLGDLPTTIPYVKLFSWKIEGVSLIVIHQWVRRGSSFVNSKIHLHVCALFIFLYPYFDTLLCSCWVLNPVRVVIVAVMFNYFNELCSIVLMNKEIF